MESPQKSLSSGGLNDSQYSSPGKNFAPNYKREGSVIGYTGFYPKPVDPPHILGQPLEKEMIRGYTGHRPNRKHLIGVPFIRVNAPDSPSTEYSNEAKFQPSVSASEKFRAYAKHLALEERYASAIQVLEDNGEYCSITVILLNQTFSFNYIS